MVTIAGLLRQDGNRRRPRSRPRRFAPEVAALETRALQTVNNYLSNVYVHPGLLPPTSNGQTIPVHIFGVISANHTSAPKGLFFVTDEYRAFEPSGPITFTPAGGKRINGTLWSNFAFSFEINFPTNRSTNTPDGRHYDLFVGATDGDGTGGLTVEVLVPKSYHAPTAMKVAKRK